MSDDEDWLDEVRSRDDLPSAPPEERERVIRQVCERLAAATAPKEAPAAGAPPPGGVRPVTQGGPTLRSPTIDAAAAEAAEAANDVVHLVAKPVGPMPAVRPTPAFAKSTDLAPDLSTEAWIARGALPFRPPSPDQPRPRAAKTVQTPVHGLEPGRTLPLGDTSIAAAVAQALPFAALPPPLTGRQYASLCAELALWPERSEGILLRYQVRGGAARAALDAYWARVHAARPEVRAAFEADFASYAGLLRA